MTLRERLQRAIEIKASEGPRKGGKLPKRPSERELETIQKQVKAVATQAVHQCGTSVEICYVMGIESYRLYSWDEHTYIALTENGQLVSVYKQPAKTNIKRSRNGSTQAMVNITATTLENIDQYFGPLIDMQLVVAP